MSPDTPVGVFLGGLFGFCATWLAFFLVRFFRTPPALYFEQKDRADKLDGIAPAEILRKGGKPIAILRARYLTNETPIQRQALDYEADSLQAVQDVKIIFWSVTAETEDLTRLMSKCNKKINAAKDPQKKRQAVKYLADHLNTYSDRMDELVTIIRAMTPTMLECTSQFLERTASKVDRATLDTFIAALDGTIKSVSANMENAHDAMGTISAHFKGVTQDLNNATSRIETAIDAYKTSLNEYKSACEQIRAFAEERFNDGKNKLTQEAL